MTEIANYPLANNLATILEAAQKRADKKTDVKSLELAFSCIDLTSLNHTDNTEHIEKMVERVNKFPTQQPDMPTVAAICVYPCFAATVSNKLENKKIGIAAVTGVFPSSQSFVEVKELESQMAAKAGATELDMVISVGAMLQGDEQQVYDEVKALKKAAGDAHLKVILESGSLPNEAIWRASLIALEAGADFIKTSTGKTEPAATPEAAVIMCIAIKQYYERTGRRAGFKPAGGIKTAKDAALYLSIVEEILGAEWTNPQLFRIGASSLANSLLIDIAKLKGKTAEAYF